MTRKQLRCGPGTHPLAILQEWMVANRVGAIKVSARPGHLTIEAEYRKRRAFRLPGQSETVAIESNATLPTPLLHEATPETITELVIPGFDRIGTSGEIEKDE